MGPSTFFDASKTRQPVDALAVLLPLVAFHALRPLAFGVGGQLRSLTRELEQGHPVSARVGHPLQFDDDDRADAGVFGKKPGKLVPAVVTRLDGPALAVEPQDPGRPREGT